MSDKDIVFSVGQVCGKDGIVAHPPVAVMKGKNSKIKFENQLGFEAKVRFFKVDDKNGTIIKDFCKGVEANGVLKIGDGKKIDCKPNVMADYSYTVEAPPLPTLDPIIIIEDAFDAGPFPWLPLLLTGFGGAAFGAFGAYKMMKMKMKKQAS